MVGIKIKHISFGTGRITFFDEKYILVEFAAGEKKFLYPDAFKKSFIAAEDPEIQRRIMEEIEEIEGITVIDEETSNNGKIYDVINTFVFENVTIRYENVTGYAVYNMNNTRVGVVWSHKQKKGELAEGQAEIRFFDEYKNIYNTWRRVFINYQRLDFSRLEQMIKERGSVTLTIDPWRGKK